MTHKTDVPAVEFRAAAKDFELRAASDEAAGVRTLSGYAALFDVETVIAGQWREVIRRGAFDGVADADCVFLMDHAGAPMARTTAGTLRLSVDDRGLKFEADLAEVEADAAALISKIERRTVSAMSFAFRADPEGGVEWSDMDGAGGKLPLRTIKRVSVLRDVSAVTWPAYSKTSVSVRGSEVAAAELAGVRDEMFAAAMAQRTGYAMRAAVLRVRLALAEID